MRLFPAWPANATAAFHRLRMRGALLVSAALDPAAGALDDGEGCALDPAAGAPRARGAGRGRKGGGVPARPAVIRPPPPSTGGVQAGVNVTVEAGSWLAQGALLNPWPAAVRAAADVLVCEDGTGPDAGACGGGGARVTAALAPEPGHEGGTLITWPVTPGHAYTLAPLGAASGTTD